MKKNKNFVHLFKRPYLNIKSINLKSVIFTVTVMFFLVYAFFFRDIGKIIVAASDVLYFIFSLDFLTTDIPTNSNAIDLIIHRRNIIFNFGKVAIWILTLLFILSFLFKDPLEKME